MQNLMKIGRSMAELLRIFYFQNGGRPPFWISIISQILRKIQICAYISVVLQNLVKIRQSAAELLRIIDNSKWRRSAVLDFV